MVRDALFLNVPHHEAGEIRRHIAKRNAAIVGCMACDGFG